MKTAVVIPTLNEGRTIGPLITQIDHILHSGYIIIVVDDNSTDRTQEVIKEMSTLYPVKLIARPRKLGFASAILDGMRYALEQNADIFVVMDADFSHDPKYIRMMMNAMTTYGADAVIGSRYISGSYDSSTLMRGLTSRAGNIFANIVLRLGVHDCTSGFKCYSREAVIKAHILEIDAEGYGLQIISVYNMKRAGLVIHEIPITFSNRLYSKTKLTKKIIIEMLSIVLKLSIKRG